MEQEFYRDEFEQLLKDTTDDFKMYPSRKVWHSIYNDLHPDRKWPSFAVCLLLLTTILYIGVTNNNSINNETRKNSSAVSIKNDHNTPPVNTDDTKTAGKYLRAVTNNNDLTVAAPLPAFLTITEDIPAGTTVPLYSTPVAENEKEHIAAATAQQPETGFENATSFTANGRTKVTVTAPAAEETVAANEQPLAITEDLPAASTSISADPVAAEKKEDIVSATPVPVNNLLAANKSFEKDTRELEWIENYAFYNRKNASKSLLKGLSTQFYVTPSIGYRTMFKNRDYKRMDNSFVTNEAARNSAAKPDITQQATINMEAGIGIVKDMNKRVRFKTGLQFNLTDYITYAQKLDHPVETNLIVNNISTGFLIVKPYMANYANIPGKNGNKLHNRTIQLSIPIGFDYKLLGNDRINWYVGGSLQPTYVSGGYSYLLSADNNYFVEGQSLLRKLNLNSSFESFVSFKTKGGGYFNIGPQFRYQLISAYKRAYIYTERPYNVGFKIGLTKPL